MHKARFYLVTLFLGFARLHRQLGFQFDLFRVGIGQPPICRVNGRQCPRVLGANRRIVMGASIPAASALFKLDRLGISFTPSHKAIHKCVLVRALSSLSEPTGGTVTPVQFRNLHSCVLPASPRICAARSQKHSQIGTAVAKRPS